MDISWLSPAVAGGTAIAATVVWIARQSARIDGLQAKSDCAACRRELDAKLALMREEFRTGISRCATAEMAQEHAVRLASQEQATAVAQERLDHVLERLDELKAMVSRLLAT